MLKFLNFSDHASKDLHSLVNFTLQANLQLFSIAFNIPRASHTSNFFEQTNIYPGYIYLLFPIKYSLHSPSIWLTLILIFQNRVSPSDVYLFCPILTSIKILSLCIINIMSHSLLNQLEGNDRFLLLNIILYTAMHSTIITDDRFI